MPHSRLQRIRALALGSKRSFVFAAAMASVGLVLLFWMDALAAHVVSYTASASPSFENVDALVAVFFALNVAWSCASQATSGAYLDLAGFLSALLSACIGTAWCVGGNALVRSFILS